MLYITKNRLAPQFLIFCVVLVFNSSLIAQCNPGAITLDHTSSTFDALLDPDGDGFITESGTNFTSGTTELSEFEIIPNSTSGWVEIQDVNESDSDITPSCGNPDLIQDDDGGDFAYYNIIDPSPGSPTSGDEYILFRFRLAQSPNGNFGYNFLVDTDNSYGTGRDANSTCGNNGYEREIQFANAGGQKGVSVYDVDGRADFNATLCDQCINVNDVQEACAASNGNCTSSDPVFVTFPLPLSYLGVSSDILFSDFFITAATASSGNATSVLGGGNVKDMGALDSNNTGCGCEGLTGCALFDCQSNCINTAFNALPIELAAFDVQNKADYIMLKWSTLSEKGNSHFEVQHSVDGINYFALGFVTGSNNSDVLKTYTYKHFNPVSGNNYYRLKQVDYDGKFEFSPIEVIYFTHSEQLQFSIQPTMARTEIQIKLNATDFREDGQLDIYNNTGQLISSFSLKNTFIPSNLNIKNYESGFYYIRLTYGSLTKTERFLKVD